MRGLTAIVVASTLFACVDLSRPLDRPCARTNVCPSGFLCSPRGICEPAGADGGAFDAALADAASADVEPADAEALDSDAGPTPEDAGPSITTRHVAIDTTTSTSFIPVRSANVDVAPASASEDYLVFLSGLVSSSESTDRAAELRLTDNDQEVDLFGHTSLNRGRAGFLSFHCVRDTTETRRISLEFRAAAGTTTVEDVRLLVLQLPAGADLQCFEDPGMREERGDDILLAPLTFIPRAAGNYLILGKASQSREPGLLSVQTRVELRNGPTRPEPSLGNHFTNSTASWQPMFTAFRATLDASAQAISLRGTSSGDPSARDWWDPAFKYRQNFTIDAGSPIPVDYSIAVVFDHAVLVAAGKSRADGADLRVVRRSGNTWTELDRLADDNLGWNSSLTAVWFRPRAPIEPGMPDASYYLYYGNQQAGPPPADGLNVFAFHDDFSGTELDETDRWTLSGGTVTVGGGRMELGPGAVLLARPGLDLAAPWEYRAKLSLPAQRADSFQFLELTDGMTYLRFVSSTAGDGAEYSDSQTTSSASFTLSTPASDHVYEIRKTTQSTSGVQAEFRRDNSPLHDVAGFANAAAFTPPLRPRLGNSSSAAGPSYDWIRLRKLITVPPMITQADEEAVGGSVASRWRHAKLIAFREDVFPGARYFEMPGLRAANRAGFTYQQREMIDPSPRSVVIQSIRISGGELGDAFPRGGELRRNGGKILATSHELDADGSPHRGYHHVAAIAYVSEESHPLILDSGSVSPDGRLVEAADAVMIVLPIAPLE